MKSDPPSVQNLIQNFNKDPEPRDSSMIESNIPVPSSPGSGGDRLAKFRMSFERRESARDVYLSERVSQERLRFVQACIARRNKSIIFHLLLYV